MNKLITNCSRCDTPGAKNVILLDRCSEISGGWGCDICELPKTGFIAIHCDECKEKEIIRVIVGDVKKEITIPIDELKNKPYHLHDWRLHYGHSKITWSNLKRFGESSKAGTSLCVCSLCGKQIENDSRLVRINLMKQAEIRLHSECLSFLIKAGIEIF